MDVFGNRRILARFGTCGLMATVVVVLGAGGAKVKGQGVDPQAVAKALTGQSSAPAAKTDDTDVAAPTKDNPEATVAETTGPITVENTVSDRQMREKLDRLLPKFPGVRTIDVDVRDGVVTLTGQVKDDDTRDRLRDFALRVQGVNLVLNDTKTDAQVMTARQLVMQRLRDYAGVVQQRWLFGVLALVILVVSALLARGFNAVGDTLLTPFSGNALLRSVMGSIISAVIAISGIFLALSVLGLTQAVLSVLGLAGVVALAVGFAFRDITENFIASVLLGVRRPFRIGDYVEVAGQAGVVKSLNTRATVLVTLEGNQVRIPNATIFKEILVNKSSSASVRGTFDIMVPYEVSTARAQEAIASALKSQDGVLSDPPPRTLVDSLEPNGVVLRTYFWMPTKGIDGFKLNSDVRLKAKVALQQASITPPPSSVAVAVLGQVPVSLSRAEKAAEGSNGNGHKVVFRPGSAVTVDQARANLRQDTAAARAADEEDVQGDKAVEHVMNAAKDNVSDEGDNLLDENHKDEG